MKFVTEHMYVSYVSMYSVNISPKDPHSSHEINL